MKKLTLAALIVLVVSLLVSTSAFANWTGIPVQLMDGKTGNPWTLGGTVNVFDCSNIGVSLGSAPVGVTGAVTVTITSSGTNRFLCIQATFNAGPGGSSADYWQVFSDVAGNSGTKPAPPVVFYTNTGPTAVVLKEVTAQPSVSNIWLPVALLGVVIVAGGFWALRRRQQA